MPNRDWKCALRVQVVAILVAISACTAEAADAVPRPPLAITDVTIVDVEHGHSSGPRTVLIDEGRITAIVAPDEARVPADAVRIDGRGGFLIPGLVDMHVHLFNTVSKRAPNDWAFPLFLRNGVTGVREMAADAASMPVVRRWRTAFADGTLEAPRILAVGMPVSGDTPAAAARAVDAAADAGADFVKVFSNVPEPQWRAIVSAARRRALPVTGHVPARVRLLAAAEGGQRSAEHLMQAYEACSTIEPALISERRLARNDSMDALLVAQEPRTLEAFDPAACSRVARALARSGQAQVPTLVLPWAESVAAHDAPESDPRWPLLRADEQARWKRILGGLQPDPVATLRWQRSRAIVSMFHDAGVTLLAGTDAPMPRIYPGYSLHDELERLVESGLSPLEALRSATFAPARFLGMDDIAGSIAVGKRADLVLLDGDPARDVRNARRIRAVVVDGRLFGTASRASTPESAI